MNKVSKNAREAFKKIPSIDDLLKKNKSQIPKPFLKHHLNITLNQIRNDYYDEIAK